MPELRGQCLSVTPRGQSVIVRCQKTNCAPWSAISIWEKIIVRKSHVKPLRNILALSGLLLMMASFVWMQVRQTERAKSAAEPKTAQPSAAPGPFAVVILDPGHG